MAIATLGLWFWMGAQSLAWYEHYLVGSHAWMMLLVGGVVFGFPVYCLLMLRGRLKQLA